MSNAGMLPAIGMSVWFFIIEPHISPAHFPLYSPSIFSSFVSGRRASMLWR